MKPSKERAADILAKYPNRNEVYFTSDVNAFTSEKEAKVHARTLDDKTITTITREEAVEAKPQTKEVSIKPLGKMNTEELKAEIATRDGLTVPEGSTKKQMVEAIEKWDAEKAAAPNGAAEAGDPPAGDNA